MIIYVICASFFIISVYLISLLFCIAVIYFTLFLIFHYSYSIYLKISCFQLIWQFRHTVICYTGKAC